MTTKSMFMVAATAVGMVAVADVWDVKFTLKTVQNDKRTSVTIRGAWDDVTEQYSFWDNKTKAPLKNVEFATANAATYRSGKSQAINAQLVWGDLDNPEGLLVAAGFGSKKSESGQVAGTFGGKPASGTWSIKHSNRDFAALNKASGTVDTAGNLAAKKAAQEFLANAQNAAEVIKQGEEASAKCDEDAAKLAEASEKLTAAEKQVADAQAKAAAAEKQVADAQAKADAAVAAAEQKADATEADLAAAQAALADAEKAKDELEAANKIMTEALETLADASSNTGLTILVQDTYQTEVDQYIWASITKARLERSLNTSLVPNVTNAVLAVSNDLAKAKATLAEAEATLADMQAFDVKDFAGISYSNNLETVLYPKYDQITNATWRAEQLDGADDEMVAATNDTYVAWQDANTTLTNAQAEAASLKKQADDIKRQFYKAGAWGDEVELAEYTRLMDEAAAIDQKIDKEYGPANDLAKAAYDDAKKVIDDFLAKKDIEALKAEIKAENDKLAKVMKEWGAYTVDNFHNTVIPGQEKTIEEQSAKRDELVAKLTEYKDNGYITDFEAETAPIAPFDQEKWNANYKTEVTDVKTAIATQDEVLAKCRDNIKAAQELAELLDVADSLNSDEFMKDLQESYAGELADKDDAPVAIAAAAEHGITLKEIKE